MKSRAVPESKLAKGSWLALGDYEDLSVFVVTRVTESTSSADCLHAQSSIGPGSERAIDVPEIPLPDPAPRVPSSLTPLDIKVLEKPQEPPPYNVIQTPPPKESAPHETPPSASLQPTSNRGELLAPAVQPVGMTATAEQEIVVSTLSRITTPPPAYPRPGVRTPPVIHAPTGAREQGERHWMPVEIPRKLKLDCYSHRGPPWTWADKDNEDFAFATVCYDHDGEAWALAGVCDGVSNSTWAERGAQIAAAVFIEVVSERLHCGIRLDETVQRAPEKRGLAAVFRDRLHTALTADSKLLFEGGYLHPSWKQDLYERTFLHGYRSAENRMEWLQTTLLATALGPRGGVALLLGDGFVRVDRRKRGQELHRKVIPLHPDGSAPERRVSLTITVDEVEQSLRGVPLEQSDRIALLLATDGVSKSPRHGLETLSIEGPERCRRFLEELAGRPQGEVESDNMSIAFASREIA